MAYSDKDVGEGVHFALTMSNKQSFVRKQIEFITKVCLYLFLRNVAPLSGQCSHFTFLVDTTSMFGRKSDRAENSHQRHIMKRKHLGK